MWIQRRMEKISWLDKVTNEEVSRHDGLHEIIEGRMRGKPARGRRRIQMLHDLANDDGFVALRRAAEGTEGWIGDTDKGC